MHEMCSILCHVFIEACFFLHLATAKIESRLLDEIGPSGRLPLTTVISFHNTDHILAEVNSKSFVTRGDKISYMKARLEELRFTSQKSAREILGDYGIPFRSFWINNMMAVDAPNVEVLRKLAHLSEVVQIRAEKVLTTSNLSLDLLKNRSNGAKGEHQHQNSWGIARIQAAEVWDRLNCTGKGVTIGIIDTGVHADHPDLHPNWRKSHGWYDPASKSNYPYDTSPKGHGTFVTGIIAGKNGIGVAPGVEWIACLGCPPEGCLESYVIACAQWMMCPTMPNGNKPDCKKAPKIVNNSWGATHDDPEDYYDTVAKTLHTAGIIPVFSIGNKGNKCQNTSYPGDSSLVIGVGATDMNDNIANFSSRGPVEDGYKPDLTAPGVQLVSASKNGGYVINKGTSFATPMVSGTVALMLSKSPSLEYDKIVNHLLETSDKPQRNFESCGDIPTTKFPNHVYGYGRLNAYKAVLASANP